MKTVWDLISPVWLFVNSAVTNSGAAYVMSLSLHSSSEALTSSKRGSEKDRDMFPAKSSIGEISVRISSRPPTGFSSPASTRRWNHASSPTSHSNDWVCRSRRSGTRCGSAIFAKETRVGAPGRFWWSEVVAKVVEAEACGDAKMRPSGTALSSGVLRVLRATVLIARPGREVRVEPSGVRWAGKDRGHAVCCQCAPAVRLHGPRAPPGEPGRPRCTCRRMEGSAKRQSSRSGSRCRDGYPRKPPRPKSDLTGAPSQDATPR
jgi:hypothetical protein